MSPYRHANDPYQPEPSIVLHKGVAHLTPHYEAAGIKVTYAKPMPTLQEIWKAGHANRLARMKRKAGYVEPLA